jgi:hypothetical protein
MLPTRFAGGSDEALRWGHGSGAEHAVPECMEAWVGEDNPVRVIDVVVDELNLAELGFSGVDHRANLADSSLNKPGWGFRHTQV